MQDDNNESLQQEQQQPPNMSTTTTTSSRHYVDKARLIKLVHENPILWDCRLPNYKRADKSKTDQWNSLGVIFNVSGERVQRTFTSLREIFRRELNNEKLLGRRFKSKWEFYKSMSFLREVIRERKPRERHPAKQTRRSQLSPSVNNPPNSSTGIDEYQYFAPNDPNNPSLQQQQQSITPPINEKQTSTTTTTTTTTTPLKSDLTAISLGNSTQLSVLSLLTQRNNGTPQQAQQQQNITSSPQQQLQQQQQQQQQQLSHMKPIDEDEVNIAQTSPATSTTPSMYIKDEIEIPDEDDDDEEEEDTTSITFNGEILYSNNNKLNIVNSNVLNELETNNSRCKRRTKYVRNTKNWKRMPRNGKNDCELLEDDDDDDIDEDELSSMESLPNNVNTTVNNGGKSKLLLSNGVLNSMNDETKVNQHDLLQEQLSSVSCIGQLGVGSASLIGGEAESKYRRHLVYTKFADFIVAKMDAMCERDADDLMDRMMLVIAQKH